MQNFLFIHGKVSAAKYLLGLSMLFLGLSSDQFLGFLFALMGGLAFGIGYMFRGLTFKDIAAKTPPGLFRMTKRTNHIVNAVLIILAAASMAQKHPTMSAAYILCILCVIFAASSASIASGDKTESDIKSS